MDKLLKKRNMVEADSTTPPIAWLWRKSAVVVPRLGFHMVHTLPYV